MIPQSDVETTTGNCRLNEQLLRFVARRSVFPVCIFMILSLRDRYQKIHAAYILKLMVTKRHIIAQLRRLKTENTYLLATADWP